MAEHADRIAWRRAGGCTEPACMSDGSLGHSPECFGDFTQHLDNAMRHMASHRQRPIVDNRSLSGIAHPNSPKP
ncbi:hypothetical protein ACFWAR_05485 [Streptomyces sp. NPDC059917]|uniref:hypothetical protein n=1 Tax=Streptomyces sp. NPDC059917 TaxID=3347002 RepID=UPI00364D8331